VANAHCSRGQWTAGDEAPLRGPLSRSTRDFAGWSRRVSTRSADGDDAPIHSAYQSWEGLTSGGGVSNRDFSWKYGIGNDHQKKRAQKAHDG
jgi:hypothetical protein